MFIEDMSVCVSHETGYIILILSSDLEVRPNGAGDLCLKYQFIGRGHDSKECTYVLCKDKD